MRLVAGVKQVGRPVLRPDGVVEVGPVTAVQARLAVLGPGPGHEVGRQSLPRCCLLKGRIEVYFKKMLQRRPLI